ncbi:glycosyltransferase family 4 protein [Leifsonia sp. EB34]|uniref:glycosyltransferase family 4 protein n=1 Tax=Leifsonia sp. EB34 TaxID=3156303 RepID=UPI0035110234
MPRVLVDLLSYTGTKGGMETYARELYREIGSRDTEFEFVALASNEGYELDTSWFPGEVIRSGLSGENRFIWAYGELVKVTSWAKRTKADLIHSPATLGTMRRSVPSVVTMHDMLYWSHPELMSTGLYTQPVKWMEKRASKAATRVLTISDVSEGEITRFLGVDRSKLEVIPLAGTLLDGVDRSRASASDPFVLATGNRRPHKNWGGLIRALPLVDESVRPRLIITGSHGDDPLAPIVRETGMGDWVELRSWVSSEEMRELYSTATIMAMPSFCDGFSLPALEAMMVGLPVMLSDIDVYREVADDAALYFDPTSGASIANALTTAATDPKRMAELSVRGRQRSSVFSWDRTATATLDAFRTALRADQH